MALIFVPTVEKLVLEVKNKKLIQNLIKLFMTLKINY
jgi:hypothetical protein